MSRLVAFAVTTLLIAAPSLAIAETPQSTPQAQTEPKVLTDIRVAVVKNALQLSPEQEKYWPAIEQAIRSRAEARRQRFENLEDRMQGNQPDRDFVQVLQHRSDNLSARGAELRTLADAWQPLYPTLSDAQKQRMRILAVVVLHGLREDMEARRDQVMDEMMDDDDAWSAVAGAGSGESGYGRD